MLYALCYILYRYIEEVDKYNTITALQNILNKTLNSQNIVLHIK